MRLKRTGLWANSDFLKLWAGETVSLFGTLVGHAALMFTAVLVLHASPLEIGVLGAAELLPDVLFGLVAGVWVDRLRRRPIMVAADIGQFFLLVTIPLAYAFDALTIGQLLAVAFVSGTFHTFFHVSYWTYLPTLVEKDEIIEGNSKMAGTWAVAEVGAFGVSGWLVQALTAPVAILVDAVSFLASAAALVRIRKPEPAPRPAEERKGVRREIVEGGRAILGEPVLRATALAHAIAGFSFRMFGAVFLLYATQTLGFEPGVLGLTWAVGGAASLVGATFAGRAAARLGLGPAMTLGLAGMGAAMLLFPAAHDASIFALLLIIGQQFGDGLFVIWDVNQVSLRQAITPEHVLGRVNAGFRVAGQGAMLAGALAGGVLGELIGLRVTLVIASCGLLGAAGVVMLSPAWSARHAAAPGLAAEATT
ncbi:MAG TPA: MFS transporter [Dehalococcoidia bacterium]|nr:MFS transporter [Dehalococcoidia bacterium]